MAVMIVFLFNVSCNVKQIFMKPHSNCLFHHTLTSEHNTFLAFTNNESIFDEPSSTYGSRIHLTTRSHSYLIYFFLLYFLLNFVYFRFFLKHVLFFNLTESNFTLEIFFDTSEIFFFKLEKCKNESKEKKNKFIAFIFYF